MQLKGVEYLEIDDKYSISEEDFEFIYQKIKRIVIKERDVTPVVSGEKPIAIVLGGQPGAGKSNIYNYYEAVLINSIVGIDCDAFREHHPYYVQIYEDCKINGGNPSEIINPFIYAISDRLIIELSDERYNMVIESTLRTPDVAKNFVSHVYDSWVDFRLKDKGYEVHLNIVGTYRVVSLQGTKERYKRQLQAYNSGKSKVPPRFIPPEFHDAVVGSICNSLHDIYQSGLMDDIKIFARSNECFYSMHSIPELDPTPILSARINNPEEASKKLINEYLHTAKLNEALDYFQIFKFENMNHIKTLNNNKGSIYCLKTLNDGRLAARDEYSNLIIYKKNTFNPEINNQNNLNYLWNFNQLKNKNITYSFNSGSTLKIIKIKYIMKMKIFK